MYRKVARWVDRQIERQLDRKTSVQIAMKLQPEKDCNKSQRKIPEFDLFYIYFWTFKSINTLKKTQKFETES